MSENKGIRKSVKIALSAVLSIIVLFFVILIEAVIAGKVLGTHKLIDGSDEINGGGATTVVMFILGFLITISFAVWFYKFLTNYKISKVKNDQAQ